MTADTRFEETRSNAGGHLVVDTVHGPVRGVDDGTIACWKAVPYAAPPVGDLRWRAPVPPSAWTEPRDASRVGPVCPQPTDPRIPLALGAPQGEDFLTLNVWAPSGTHAGAGKPVMVWVHGGAYILGSATQPLYHGRRLAADGDVIVVTVNYRLGALGFLELATVGGDSERFATNVGLRDVIAALTWVRDNIAAFGGDPGRVTLFGESAGGGIVASLLGSPAAAGLFHAAIAQSAPVTSSYDSEQAGRIAARFLEVAGVGRDDLSRLADMPIEAIVDASRTVFNEVPVRTPGRLAYAPIVDRDILPDYPIRLAQSGRTHPVPLIIGTNRNEAALFRYMKLPLLPIKADAIQAMFAQIAAEQPELALPERAQLERMYRRRRAGKGLGLASDLGFRMPSIWFADGHRATAPVYLYRFDFATPMLRAVRMPAAHATELPFVWGNLGTGRKDPMFALGGRAAGTEVSRRMRARWTSFARDGAPGAPAAAPQWQPYDDARATLVIDRHDSVVDDLDAPVRAAWGDDVLSFR
ncbi:carboxylesterase/lipase family protein [Mycolicibacterium sp. 018/SC-01/001]|uniref:carboxylesterase/lipase family protein n=1 Tax=Mycolicibacterium sp. 018/SC-01/001 TaxID=2592069 RepID=UPI00117FFA38|nr:carboxylesterase/lipase family protein [Mycolicibacterium sp. 018/SC-01/001]TRW82338.1 carboxylesterase/lipase family protein [Mycolicibacterium sp. 018/SC-01/001]